MNPYLDLQEAFKTRLEAHEFLADLPMITETLGNITKRVDAALIKGGVKQNDGGKAGIALLIFTPSGRPLAASTRSLSLELTTVRVGIFVRPVINDGASGLQKDPLEVHHAVKAQVQSWDRGSVYNGRPIQFTNWGSAETPSGELSYFTDFETPHFINLTETNNP